jgi:hypothetical protein
VRHCGAAIWVALLVLAVISGCGSDSQDERDAGTTAGSSAVSENQTTQQETTREGQTSGGETTSEEPVEVAVAPEPPFTAVPETNGGVVGAADGIEGVRFDRHEGYDRAVIDFGEGGSTASQVPIWSLSSPEGEGYARITFPSVETTSVSDGSFGGSIMDNFYVVRAPGGGMFVDVFATGAFQYRVIELSEPGRLILDYRPASVDLSFPIPAQAGKTVLFEPRDGEAITSPLEVNGYSRNSEASNTITLMDSSGNVLVRSTALSSDWLDTWGYFEASLEFPAFEGTARLLVGGESSRDGSFEGVALPVTYGGDQR